MVIIRCTNKHSVGREQPEEEEAFELVPAQGEEGDHKDYVIDSLENMTEAQKKRLMKLEIHHSWYVSTNRGKGKRQHELRGQDLICVTAAHNLAA